MRLKRFITAVLCGVLLLTGSGVADLNVFAEENDLDVSESVTEEDDIETEAETIDYDNYDMDIALERDENDLLGAGSSANDSDYATITYTTNVNVTPKEDIINRINEIRYEAFVEGIIDAYVPVIWSSELEAIAFQRAAESSVFWGHTRPDGTSCFTCETENGSSSWGEIIASPSNAISAINLWYTEKDDYVNHTGGVTGHYTQLIFSKYIGIASCGVTVGETASYQQGTEEQICTSGTKTVSMKVSKSNLSKLDFDYDGVESDGTITVSRGYTKKITPVVSTNDGWTGWNDVISAVGTYTSSDTSVVTVDNNGNVKGISDGKATITFKDGPFTQSFEVFVKSNVDMYRLYNPNSGEHFYTASTTEKNNLVNLGWRYEGIGWKAPVSSNTPVYRLYNKNAGDHHYTMNEKEKDYLVSIGWKYEGIGWYSDDDKSVPLYRQYNPNAKAGSHNYTTSKAENDNLVKLGWRGEGVGWYGVK